MNDRQLEALRSVLLSTAIGIVGAVALVSWGACDPDSIVCMFTGAAK